MTTCSANVLTTQRSGAEASRAIRRAAIVACAMAVVFALHQAAEAAPIKFEFETTTLAGAPFGKGWFSFDEALFPYPYHVENPPLFPDLFLTFHYSDPHLGVLGKDDVATAHFEIGVDPFTGVALPTISLWAFNIANSESTRFLTGSLDGAPPPGVQNTTSFFRSDPLDPWVGVALVSTFPTPAPEPVSLLLFGTAVGGYLARRRLARR
jgi:hypothetical protein